MYCLKNTKVHLKKEKKKQNHSADKTDLFISELMQKFKMISPNRKIQIIFIFYFSLASAPCRADPGWILHRQKDLLMG